MSPDEPLLLDMMTPAVQAVGFTNGVDEAQFRTSALHQNAVIRSLEVIGEAATRISPELRQAHPEIPWRDIIGMRHRLIHNYTNVSLDVVWDVLCNRLPQLIAALRPLITPDA